MPRLAVVAAVSISVLLRSPVIIQEVPTNRASHNKVTVQGRKAAVEFGILLKKDAKVRRRKRVPKVAKKTAKNVAKAKKGETYKL